ncbi:molybdopterin synthase catalytic subunit MoaE [Solemya elarraichensis gill symbiont]|uniref:Molybdopterin synthase catalytic subunit n=1 Tax=Solemya elarraichensis gill symbiont TaxID=1918949 RepID=A0A1T2LDC3_9GAMM|nr:molybdopterin synthase catalytic subunit MoaE [Solemya elarraichensis gill symbiont]OOZ43071.1 molybdenum cofactor biosynthesis protein MoaE [Solemya elarraichensis gill symbiont]
MPGSVRIQHEDFDIGVEVRRFQQARTEIGAVATFTGLVRDLNLRDKVSSMTLEHYPGMTEKSLQEILEQAIERWQLIDAMVIHRVGKLMPGDQIVFVATASAHRGDAFSACEFIMDFLKTKAPFWKKEETASGSHWVDARETDSDAAERWK